MYDVSIKWGSFLINLHNLQKSLVRRGTNNHACFHMCIACADDNCILCCKLSAWFHLPASFLHDYACSSLVDTNLLLHLCLDETGELYHPIGGVSFSSCMSQWRKIFTQNGVQNMLSVHMLYCKCSLWASPSVITSPVSHVYMSSKS